MSESWSDNRALLEKVRPRVAPIIDSILEERTKASRTTLLFDLFARLVRSAHVPLTRATLSMPQLHPQLAARTLVWELESGGAVELGREHGIVETEMYQRSPIKLIYNGRPPIRRHLEDPDCPDDFPVLADLRMRGFTDYMIRALPFSTGARNAIGFATHQDGGFTDEDFAIIESVLPAFGSVLELQHMRSTARILLDTYVGHDTGGRVLNGAIKRGDGEIVHAVLWFCDLRDFTVLSESLPLEEVIALLNGYFDCVALPVEAQGGEILKFIGDAMLAIFPCGDSESQIRKAADRACAAADGAIAALAAANGDRERDGQQPIRCGIALHIGEVLYGNIGSASRLDFTVVGPAVNLVSRLESLCPLHDCPVVVSEAIAKVAMRRFRSLGEHELKGIIGTAEAFTFG